MRHGLNSRNWASALNCDGRYGLGLLAACALLLVPQLGGSAATNLLRYDRAAITAGQWWRLLTAHIAHLGLHHTLLNTLGLVFLWALFAREWKPLQWAVIVLVAIVAIDSGLWFLDAGIAWYVGASGVLHGLMTAGAVGYIRRRDPLRWIMAGLLAVKLAYEHIHGPLPFAGRGVPVVVDAHLYGALAGLVTSIFLTLWRPRGSQKPKPPGLLHSGFTSLRPPNDDRANRSNRVRVAGSKVKLLPPEGSRALAHHDRVGRHCFVSRYARHRR